MPIEVANVNEINIDYCPKDSHEHLTATVRDICLTNMTMIDIHFVRADIDGAIAFLQAIKKALSETKKEK